MNSTNNEQLVSGVALLCRLGIALSAERDSNRLLEQFLLGAKTLTRADGGTLYLISENHDKLRFAVMQTTSLNYAMGGATGTPIPFAPIPLHRPDGSENLNNVAAYTALKGEAVNIADAYSAEGFDFSGARQFDAVTGYRSQSFLTIPMKNHEDDVIGVLQLINATDPTSGQTIPFGEGDQRLAESLASQAAVALTNKQLIGELHRLFEAFVEVMATALDQKSPYNGGHCRRVPELTLLLADAASATNQGALAEFKLSDEERYALKIAGWLHDCGKVTTPEYVIDKSTKLETIHDRIYEVEARFSALKQQWRCEMLEAKLAGGESGTLEAALADRCRQLDDDLAFISKSNIGGEFMADAALERVARIATLRWHDVAGNEQSLLTENEVYNLGIRRGTLTTEEREVINHHIVATIDMLAALPFPKHLRQVPEYAGGHHERFDGRGYPKGLKGPDMSVPARVMAIADIFEALTACDRPYKQGKTLTEALTILGRMKLDGHVDPDLFDIFIRERVYLRYAESYLKPEQIDEVDHSKIPGYSGD